MKKPSRRENVNPRLVTAAFTVTLATVLVVVGCRQKRTSQAPLSGKAVSRDGVAINYCVQGTGSLALVFVHGWSCDGSYWDQQLPYFSRRYKVVAVDLAGHGESGLDRKEWTIPAFGADVAAVVKQLDLKQVVLIGHSMGGDVVTEAVQMIPDRVKALVLVDSFRRLDTNLTGRRLERYLADFRADFQGRTDKMVRGIFGPASDPELIEATARDMSSAPPEVAIACLEALNKWRSDRLREALAVVTVPIIAINSDARGTDIAAFETAFSNFKFKFMSNAGHFLMTEAPETFNKLLAETLNELQTAK